MGFKACKVDISLLFIYADFNFCMFLNTAEKCNSCISDHLCPLNCMLIVVMLYSEGLPSSHPDSTHSPCGALLCVARSHSVVRSPAEVAPSLRTSSVPQDLHISVSVDFWRLAPSRPEM